MSGITRRIVYMREVPIVNGITQGRGVLKFSDFSSCVTSAGSCWEPFGINLRLGISESFSAVFDPTDMMRRIDTLDSVGISESRMMSDGRPLHAFNQSVHI